MAARGQPASVPQARQCPAPGSCWLGPFGAGTGRARGRPPPGTPSWHLSWHPHLPGVSARGALLSGRHGTVGCAPGTLLVSASPTWGWRPEGRCTGRLPGSLDVLRLRCVSPGLPALGSSPVDVPVRAPWHLGEAASPSRCHVPASSERLNAEAARLLVGVTSPFCVVLPPAHTHVPHTHLHLHMHTHVCAQAHTPTQTSTTRHAHTCSHARTRLHTHSRMHTHTLPKGLASVLPCGRMEEACGGGPAPSVLTHVSVLCEARLCHLPSRGSPAPQARPPPVPPPPHTHLGAGRPGPGGATAVSPQRALRLPAGEEDGRDQAKLETKVWEAHNPLVDKQIDQFLVVAR